VVAASANYTVTATGPGGNGQSVVSVAVADTAPNIAYVRSSISGVPGTGIIPDTVVLVGTGAVSVYHVSPALPSGLTLDSVSGLISGTPTVAAAAANYTVTATGPGGNGSTVVSVTVQFAAPSITYIRSTIAALRNASITPDTAVSSGGPVTVYHVSPALPAGLSLDSVSGILSGTPTVVAASANYTVTAQGPGGSGQSIVSITVSEPVPAITYVRSSISAVKGVGILADTAVSSGGAVDSFVVSPVLPAGLSLSKTTGRISGTPTAVSASANYTVTAMGPGGNGVATVSIAVADTAPAISYRRTSLVLQRDTVMIPDSAVSTPSSGAVTVYHVSPALPAGLSLDTLTGIISGTPTLGVSPAVVCTVTASGPGGNGTATVSIAVYRKLINLSYQDDPVTYVLGVLIDPPNAASVTGTVTNWSVSPALPPGMILDSVNGSLRGTPSGSQRFGSNYTVTASNPVSSTSYTINIAIVGAPSNLSYADDLPTYAVGTAINPPNTPTIQGIVTFYTVSPSLPAGVVLDATTGYILGTPTAVSASRDYTITGFNPGGSAATTINLTVITVP
jgi:hypothetical protein